MRPIVNKILSTGQPTVIFAVPYSGHEWVGFGRLRNEPQGAKLECMLTTDYKQLALAFEKPGFISDPTVDESNNSIILAHCLGTTKMDGSNKPAASYKLRTIMERQEGIVTQVEMRIGQKVTQVILVRSDHLPYFTGEIIDTSISVKDYRLCRTKITVRVEGNVTNEWICIAIQYSII